MPKIQRFVPNTSDNIHCFQACYSMVIETLTGLTVSMKDAEKGTKFIEGKLTWNFAGWLSFAEMGLYVRNQEDFDFELFVLDPELALSKQIKDKKIVQNIMDITNVDKETMLVKKCLNHPQIILERKIPNINDIELALKADAMLITNLNSRALLKKDGYSGHSVIVEQFNGKELLLQNPGNPPAPNQRVSLETYLSAWHYPSEESANACIISNHFIK